MITTVSSKPKKNEPGVVGRNLSRLMRELKVGPSELARRSGLSRVAIWELREGQNYDAKRETVQKLARALGVDPSELEREESGPLDVGALVAVFEASDLARLLVPPLTDEERVYLRGLSPATWAGLPPATPEGILFLVQWRRSAKR